MSNLDISKLTAEEYLFYLQYEYANKNYLHRLSYPPEELFDKFVNTGALEKIIKPYLVNHPTKLQKEKEKIIRKVLKKLKSIKTPTTIEDVLTYSLLRDLLKKVETAAAELEIPIPKEKYLFGTLPTGMINASLIPVPSGGSIVAINQGLFTFINLVSKAISIFVPFKNTAGKLSFSLNQDDIEKELNTNLTGHYRFIDAFSKYISTFDPAKAEAYILETSQTILASLLRDTAEQFIVAHEYAHLILKDNKSNSDSITNNDLICEYPIDWIEEYIADTLGLRIVLHSNLNKGWDHSLSYIGVEFLFTCLSLLEEIDENNDKKQSHPPAKLRREFLRYQIGDQQNEISEAVLELGDIISNLMMQLWERNRDAIINKSKG